MNPEPALAAAMIALALLPARFHIRQFGWWWRSLARLARRKHLSILVAALLPLLLRCMLLPLFPIPEPRLHDEFSFLLGAGTLLEGRLASPQRPFWVPFESMHILSRPTYWQSPRAEPLYNNREMRHFVCRSGDDHVSPCAHRMVCGLLDKIGAHWRFYLGPLLIIPLLALLLLWRTREGRRLLFIASGFSLSLAGQVWHNPHYRSRPRRPPELRSVELLLHRGHRRVAAGSLQRLLPGR